MRCHSESDTPRLHRRTNRCVKNVIYTGSALITPCKKRRPTMSHTALLRVLATILGFLVIVGCRAACPLKCTCRFNQPPRTVVCSKQDLVTFPENISDIVEHLDLSTNLLTELTSVINHLTELQYLNLARNQLSSLPNELSSLKSLRRLDLSENKIHDVTDISSIGQLPSITVLYLSRNPLTTLNGLMSSTLQALDSSQCEIKELTNSSLGKFPGLTTLSLAGNPLKSIDAPWSPKLQWLDMSNCLLNYLTPDTLQGFPDLQELRLANNPTLVLSTRHTTLIHPKLKKLDVSRCNLDRPGLHGFPSLTHARLSRNMIRLLPDRIFAQNRQLSHLNLNSNNVQSLNASTFVGLVKLQLLDLSMNGLQDVHPLAFHENVELKVLNLSYNVLYDFPNLITAASTIDLSLNFINSVKKNDLANMPKLRSLNLNDNRLQSIPDGFRSITLKNLELRRNRVVQLTNSTFLELPQLQRLDLSGNRLTEAMSPRTFRNNPDLHVIKLDDNPWRCDCVQLYETYDFLTDPPGKTARSSLICQSPANVSGYSWEGACVDAWNGSLYYNKDRTWGLVLISVLTIIVFFGSVVSITHTMRLKRRAIERREELNREEARERLMLLHRRNRQLEEELIERPPEPRIHPMELLGPPSYEEAVQMPRLAQSLDALDEISVETSSIRVLGSVDNLRAKKRRTRRPKKRTQSEDDLLRRQERREERIRRERNNSTGNICSSDLPQQPGSQRNSRCSSTRRLRRHSMMDESVDSGSARGRPRPQTPSAKKKNRRRTIRDGHSTDDEDSDIHAVGLNRSIVIRELRREPRSGYRESVVERDS